jgi:hypothetical protein
VDCDEFIPEWELESLPERLNRAEYDILPMRYVHFYGNYRVYHRDPEKHHWPLVKWSVHRNLPDLEIWGDGSNIRHKTGSRSPQSAAVCECHHFGRRTAPGTSAAKVADAGAPIPDRQSKTRLDAGDRL